MPRKSKHEQELGYFRAAWDEIRVMEADFMGDVKITLKPQQRPGVFNIEMEFGGYMVGPDGELRRSSITRAFPDASTAVFSGMIWHLAMDLSRQVAEAQEQLKPRGRKRGSAA